MIDTKRIHKIQETIRETTKVGLEFFNREFEKFNQSIADSLKVYDEEVTNLNKEIAQAVSNLKKAQEEQEEIDKVVEANKDKLKELDEKSRELKEKEENLLELHKVLTNREKVLDAKEKILQEKERRVNG